MCSPARVRGSSRSGRRTARGSSDYERALGPDTAVILRVHQSNFRVVGFTEQPALAELAAVAARAGLPLVDDLGSGALSTIGDESTAAASLAAGADLVCFSGDKLLGGPQAGILVGRADLVERLRRHPLQRALRADKLTLAALEGTLALALDPERARARDPRAADARRAGRGGARSGPSASPASSTVRSRRRSRAWAAARSRSRSCRASRARSRRRCSILFAPASRRSSGSFATDACSSTCARSPTARSTRWPPRSPRRAHQAC